MSKKLSLLLVVSILFLLNKVSAQSATIKKLNDSTIMVPSGVTVPKNNTYFIKSATGKTLSTYKAGQKVRIPANRVIDCVQIPCPGSFGPDVVCWKCKERPVTSAVN